MPFTARQAFSWKESGILRVRKEQGLAERASEERLSEERVDRKRSGEAKPRAFRVQLRGAVLVLLHLPNRRTMRAALHMLSSSGGVIHLEKPLDEKIEVELLFHVDGVAFRSKAEMLFPMWATQGWLQPFRFIDLPKSCQAGLDANLRAFLQRMGATKG